MILSIQIYIKFMLLTIIYFSYIVSVGFNVGGNRCTRRKPLTCRKSLTNYYIMLHWAHSPSAGFELIYKMSTKNTTQNQIKLIYMSVLFGLWMFTVTSSKLFSFIRKGHPYHILLFGVVYGCLSSLPAIGQLLLITAAIFNNSYDISAWLIDGCHHFQQLFSDFSNGHHL